MITKLFIFLISLHVGANADSIKIINMEKGRPIGVMIYDSSLGEDPVDKRSKLLYGEKVTFNRLGNISHVRLVIPDLGSMSPLKKDIETKEKSPRRGFRNFRRLGNITWNGWNPENNCYTISQVVEGNEETRCVVLSRFEKKPTVQ